MTDSGFLDNNTLKTMNKLWSRI